MKRKIPFAEKGDNFISKVLSLKGPLHMMDPKAPGGTNNTMLEYILDPFWPDHPRELSKLQQNVSMQTLEMSPPEDRRLKEIGTRTEAVEIKPKNLQRVHGLTDDTLMGCSSFRPHILSYLAQTEDKMKSHDETNSNNGNILNTKLTSTSPEPDHEHKEPLRDTNNTMLGCLLNLSSQYLSKLQQNVSMHCQKVKPPQDRILKTTPTLRPDGCPYYLEDFEFYKKEIPGIKPIYNSVTVSLDGPGKVLSDRVALGAAHMRLYNAFYGHVLDLSSFVSPWKLIYSKATSGSFYYTFTCTEYCPATDEMIEYWVRLVIDCREGWCYGFINRHGHFEFFHRYEKPYICHKYCKMLDFPADYSIEGIAPEGLGNIEMGGPPMQAACIALSNYDGQDPAPRDVREACGVLIHGSCENSKFHPSLTCCSKALSEGHVLTLDASDLTLLPKLKNWSDIGKWKLQYFLQMIASPGYRFEPNFPPIPGLLTVDDAFATVSYVPYNVIPRPPPNHKNARTWGWSKMEFGSDSEGLIGRPHEWSHHFLGTAPYIPEMEQVRLSERIIDGPVTGILANKVGRCLGTSSRKVKCGAVTAA